MKRLLCLAVLVLAVSFGLNLVYASNGVQVQLVVLTDESGSVRIEAFGQQMEGLARALVEPDTLLPDGSVEFAHVRFGTGLGVEEWISPTVVESEDIALDLANRVRTVEQAGGGTPLSLAMEVATELIVSSEYYSTASKRVLVIATDGRPDDVERAKKARDEALSAGIDLIYVIPFGDADFEFLKKLVKLPHAFTPIHPPRTFQEAEEAFKGAIRGLVDRRLVPVADVRVDDALPSRDDNTGLIHVTRQTGGSIDLSVPAFCPDGSRPDAVKIEVQRESSSEIIAETELRFLGPTWVGTVDVPSVAREESFQMFALINCRGTIFRQLLGTVTLIDPSGFILDADTGEAIIGAIVLLQQQVGGEWVTVNPFAWPIVPSVNPQRSGPDGHYGWVVPPGTYRVFVEADNYMSSISRVVEIPPEVTDLHVKLKTIPRLPGPRALTVELRWGEGPHDLDLHLFTPDGEHICFGHMQGVGAQQDVDVTSSFGPESIAIIDLIPGSYEVWVHHYSGEGNLAESLARVKLLNEEFRKIREFAVPLSGTCQKGNSGRSKQNAAWGVFTLVVNESGEIEVLLPIGECVPEFDHELSQVP